MHLPEINIDSDRCDSCSKCVNVCPEEILIKTGDRITTQNETNCTLCMDCVDSCPKDPSAIEITWDKNAFVFKIESTGALLPERIMIEAVNIFNKKVKDFSKQLKKGKKK